MKLLLIGPRSSEVQSGISVPFELLVDFVSKQGLDFKVVDNNSKNYSHKLWMFLFVASQIFYQNRNTHVGLHATYADVVFLGPLLLLRRFILGGEYSIRKFAGSFDRDYDAASRFVRWYIRKTLKGSSANFFETKTLEQSFSRYNRVTRFLPNIRLESVSHAQAPSPSPGSDFRVLFVGKVIPEKGVLDLVEALQGQEGISLSIVGAADNSDLEARLRNCHPEINRIKYVENSQIYSLMSQYHCLALPSYYHGEGISGVVIEAFMCGLPVVVSNWNVLPEICGSGGIVVEVKNRNAIAEAVNEIKCNWETYHRLALKESEKYHLESVYKKYLQTISNS